MQWCLVVRLGVVSDLAFHHFLCAANSDALVGPTYTDYEVFDLNVMVPYTLPFLYNSFSAITPDVVLYLPRTSDLRQLAKHGKSGEKLKVTHYCMHGASKALCVYFGSFAVT